MIVRMLEVDDPGAPDVQTFPWNAETRALLSLAEAESATLEAEGLLDRGGTMYQLDPVED